MADDFTVIPGIKASKRTIVTAHSNVEQFVLSIVTAWTLVDVALDYAGAEKLRDAIDRALPALREYHVK